MYKHKILREIGKGKRPNIYFLASFQLHIQKYWLTYNDFGMKTSEGDICIHGCEALKLF